MVGTQQATRINSMNTPYPAFEVLFHNPAALGGEAHRLLEVLLAAPVASRDSETIPLEPNDRMRAGLPLGDSVGRDRRFTDNLPQIALTKNNAIARLINEGEADTTEQAKALVDDRILELITLSGICTTMHRTLDKPFPDMPTTQDYIARNADDGIILLARGGISNWTHRRINELTDFIGSLDSKTAKNIRGVVLAGSGRKYAGATELWRPEIALHEGEITIDEKGNRISSLSELGAMRKIYKPKIEMILSAAGINAPVDVEGIDEEKASGDKVLSAALSAHDAKIRDGILVEFGNAPAGYILLRGALVAATDLAGFDPTRQFVGITDSVRAIQPVVFNALSPEDKARVQNADTGLNSLNGWLEAIALVNRYYLTHSRS